MGKIRNLVDGILKKGIKFSFTFPWFGEKDLPDIHPSNVKRTDAVDDIINSDNKKINCSLCKLKKEKRYMGRCTSCGKLICNTCYVIKNGKFWCKKCLKEGE